MCQEKPFRGLPLLLLLLVVLVVVVVVVLVVVVVVVISKPFAALLCKRERW